MKHLIAIVPHRVEPDSFPTYFVDIVTEDAAGRLHYATLRVCDSAPQARMLAAEYGRTLSLRVLDPTLFGAKP